MELTPLESELITRLREIPDGCRSFEVVETKLAGTGLTKEALASFAEAGLPLRSTSEGRCFDPFDLSNLALHLRLPSLQRMAMRSWRSALVSCGQAESTSIDLAYLVRPDAEWDKASPVRILRPHQAPTLIEPKSEEIWRRKISLRSETPLLPDDITDLLARVTGRLTFFMMSEAHRWDTDRIVATGMAECGGASKLLALSAKEEGFSARHIFGFILAQPYASPHYWVEFDVDGVWRPAEPLLLSILRASLQLDPKAWPTNRSPGGALLRLAEVVDYEAATGRPILEGFEAEEPRLDPIVVQDGRDLLVSYPATISYERVLPLAKERSEEAK